jgi:hypothetical protein
MDRYHGFMFIPVYYMLWTKFSVWYHVFFLLSLAPGVLFGAALKNRHV